MILKKPIPVSSAGKAIAVNEPDIKRLAAMVHALSKMRATAPLRLDWPGEIPVFSLPLAGDAVEVMEVVGGDDGGDDTQSFPYLLCRRIRSSPNEDDPSVGDLSGVDDWKQWQLYKSDGAFAVEPDEALVGDDPVPDNQVVVYPHPALYPFLTTPTVQGTDFDFTDSTRAGRKPMGWYYRAGQRLLVGTLEGRKVVLSQPDRGVRWIDVRLKDVAAAGGAAGFPWVEVVQPFVSGAPADYWIEGVLTGTALINPTGQYRYQVSDPDIGDGVGEGQIVRAYPADGGYIDLDRTDQPLIFTADEPWFPIALQSTDGVDGHWPAGAGDFNPVDAVPIEGGAGEPATIRVDGYYLARWGGVRNDDGQLVVEFMPRGYRDVTCEESGGVADFTEILFSGAFTLTPDISGLQRRAIIGLA